MEIKRISDEVVVSPQIEISDLARIKELGFASIICNRPDGETPDQPNWAEIEAAAQKLGMTTCFQPVISGTVCKEDGAEFRAKLAELPKPVFAYCRTGTRCAQLWSYAQTDQMSQEDIAAAAEAAGYDVTGLFSKA